jgi:hypothetical protein
MYLLRTDEENSTYLFFIFLTYIQDKISLEYAPKINFRKDSPFYFLYNVLKKKKRKKS